MGENRNKKIELIRKTDVKLDKKPVSWNEIKTLFDIDTNFHRKVDLAAEEINVIKPEQEKIKEMHRLRVKYFHPFKLPGFDNLDKDAEKARKARNLTRELLRDFYGFEF